MNDISLSGCFFADLQTNENKDIKKTVINEVSGDSFFFNVSFYKLKRLKNIFFYFQDGQHDGDFANYSQPI